jgi:hypothetical protein
MTATVIVALISGAVAILGIVFGYILNKRREREAEWRKLKLEHYKDYVAALSGIVNHTSGNLEQTRYSNAFNGLTLVAPPPVLKTLYAFQQESSIGNKNKSRERNLALMEEMLREIRKDVHPFAPNDEVIGIYMIDVVPRENS